jgi:muramoyltetrapeptide carboxypeptidase
MSRYWMMGLLLAAPGGAHCQAANPADTRAVTTASQSSASVEPQAIGEPRRPMRWPARLRPGDTIMFVAPAGELDKARMQLAKERLEAMGFRVTHRDDLYSQVGYLAGEDRRRADELMQAFRDPQVQGIFPGTGGYGTMRILAELDYEIIRTHPKVLIGFSDITALHAAVNRRAGLVTFHSPNPMWGLGSPENLADFSADYFWRAVADLGEPPVPRGTYTIEIPADVPQPVALGKGVARGRLTGGNLSLVSALEGTPYAVDPSEAILLIEDTREAPYRIDRMLRQLQLAGKLSQFRGAVLGQFTRNYDREEDQMTDDARFSVDGVLRQYFAEAGIPVLMNYPVGHHRMNATLPLGGQVEVDADAGVLRVLAP